MDESEEPDDECTSLPDGPDLEDVRGILSSETARKMRERLDAKSDEDVRHERAIRERFG